jgi:RNA polymerase sigma-70 factor (ECF subfamily)
MMGNQLFWLQAAQQGDKAAFGHLVKIHQEQLLKVAYAILGNRHDAEDVVQEAFVKAYLVLEQLKEGKAFRHWLLRIMVNKAINWKKKPNRFWTELDNIKALRSEENPERHLEEREQGRQIEDAMKQLSAQHRAVLVLREEEMLSYEEIAELLGLPIGTVRSRISYGRQKLREAFFALDSGGKGGDE